LRQGGVRMVDLDFASQALPVLAGSGGFIYAFLYLIRRGDSQQRENINELRKQRDEQERRADKLAGELERAEVEYRRFVSEQRQVRHDLKGELETFRMERDLCLRRLRDAGVDPDLEEL
jgi:hypothetical protein